MNLLHILPIDVSFWHDCAFISVSAWFSEHEDPVITRVNQRIAAVTGLDLETAEELQVFIPSNHYILEFQA